MRRTVYFCSLVALLATASTAFSGTKEEILRLQSDVLAMQNQIRMLEKNIREQTDGIKSLVAQLNDQVGKSNLLLGRITAALDNQTAGDKSGNQALLQEVRNLAAKFDDSNMRLSALAQQIQDLKVQSKPIDSRGFSSGGGEAPGTASPDAMYNQAYSDLVQGNFDLAVNGFTNFIQTYPAHDKADDAQYGIGEAFYNSNKLPQAVAAFTRVINDYPNGDKLASAYFKRGKAELAMHERDNAIVDFRTVIDKYPDATEASLAKTELDNLGVPLKPPKAAPSKRRPRE